MTPRVAIAVALLALAGCATDRSAPLSEVEQRAIARREAPPTPTPRPAPRPAPRDESPEVFEDVPTLEPEPVVQVPVEEGIANPPAPEPVAAEPAVAIDGAPSYLAVAKIYNQRIARLPRIWANAVFDVDFVDQHGKSRAEQGNGHIQFQRPHFLALDIGKAGETYFWAGCNKERFWVFDLQKDRTAHVGSLSTLTRERAAELGLPAIPSEFPMLMGIAPLPTDAHNATVRVVDGGKSWRIILPPREGDHVSTRLFLDPKNVWPTRVEQLDLNGNLLLESVMTDYRPVKIAGEGGFFPRIPGSTRIQHFATSTHMHIRLDDPVDDRQIKPANFDYDVLKDMLNVQQEIDVDQQLHQAAPQGN